MIRRSGTSVGMPLVVSGTNSLEVGVGCRQGVRNYVVGDQVRVSRRHETAALLRSSCAASSSTSQTRQRHTDESLQEALHMYMYR